jgi:hypothetical protein
LFDHMNYRTVALALALFTSPAAVWTQDGGPTAAPHAEAPPAALAKPVAARLSTGGVRVVVPKGPVTLDFWWVADLALNEGAAVSWADIEEGALVGAVDVSAAYRDVRGRVIKPGVYTLRYGIQPQNGDHLGVSPFREFLLVSPAAVDTDPAAHGHDGTIELSRQAIGGSHPGVLSIDPPVVTGAPLQLHKTELGHDAVIMEVPVTRSGKPAGTLKFGVVVVGRIEA